MKLIVLAAGDSFELDGFNKLLINHPKYNKTILELYKNFFNVEKIEIVVGFKSLEIMNAYPNFDYIYNKKWQTTGSGYSLALALTTEPCYVISSDFLIDIEKAKDLLDKDNFALIKKSESRRLSSLNVKLDDSSSCITEVYRGKSYKNDPEILGVFKISDPDILRLWKKNGFENPHNYAGESLPFQVHKISTLTIDNDIITEINTPEDYINFLKK